MNNEKLFRKVALERLSSPEHIDEIFQLVPPLHRLAFVVMMAAVCVLLLWSVVGRVPLQLIANGEIIRQGEVFVVETFVTPGSAEKIKVGMNAMVGITLFDPRTYGFMVGKVASITELPDQDNPVFKITVIPETDPATPSGYRWTIGQGIPIPLQEQMQAIAYINFDQITPIQWILASNEAG